MAEEHRIMSRQEARAAQSAVDSSAVVASYTKGASIKAAGGNVGRSEFFAWKALRRADVALRRPGNPRSIRPERSVDPNLLADAVRQYRDGKSASAIEREGGVSRPTLVKELRRLGISVRLQANGDPDAIIRSYAAGHSMTACAALHQCTKRRVGVVLRNAGIDLHTRRMGACPVNARRLGTERRVFVRRATPAWADKAAILAVYAKAARLTEETGVEHEVDHVIPLKSKKVCGLHIAANLRPLPKEENRRKRNRLLPELLTS